MEYRKGWHEVTIKEYYELLDIYSSDMNDLDKQIKVYELLTGETINDTLSYIEFNKMYREKFTFLESLPQPYEYIEKSYTIGGKEYTMMKNPNDLTVTHYQDIDTLCKGEVEFKHIHILAAVLFVPKGCKYGEYDLDVEIEHMLNHLDVEKASHLVDFFLNYRQIAVAYSMGLLNKQMKKEMKKEMMKRGKMDITKVLKINRFLSLTDF